MNRILFFLQNMKMFATRQKGSDYLTLYTMNIKNPSEASIKYFLNLSTKASSPGQTDENGVFLFDLGGNIGPKYHPVAIAHYALANHQLFLDTGKDMFRRNFLAQAEWFVQNQKREPILGSVWQYDYDWILGIKAPWISAMAQGLVISTLIRASRYSNKERYVTTACNAVLSFKVPVSEGGVRSSIRGKVFFEEFPTDPPMHVLNGFIFALFGLYDCGIILGDESAKTLFWEGIQTLRSIISEFDTGYWSKYDLYKSKTGRLAFYVYHRLHILLMEVLYLLTKDSLFQNYKNKWIHYERRKTNRLAAAMSKMGQRVLRGY
jgi:hypothetical protein